ncbi:uncharacterized protein LOC109863010 [Pseudomyrmex gracilis]|uniref:uncharacterized protein LOC109863010 n=1 Tax=Pseudomyrmex gracilis TaxID=219809 RepID=UPI000995691B|nr:uncharacterized protein LOC109863010 [Pseudomyrmex gracilis]
MFNGKVVTGEKTSVKSFITRNRKLYHASDLRVWYDQDVMDATMTALEEFQERDSGWALVQILNLKVNVNNHNSMRARCQVQITRKIQFKHAVVNYSACASVLNFDKIEFPITLHQVARFERNNVSVNVFTATEQGHGYVPLHFTSNKKNKYVNPLYVPDQQDGHVGHFAWIKNLSRLVSLQLSKKKTAKYICDRCLHYFHTSKKLAEHIVDCERLNDNAVVFSAEGKNRLRFKNYNKERVPMMVHADLECVLEKQNEEQNASSAHKYQRHSVFSIGYYVNCAHINIGYRSYRGENCVQWFVKKLHILAKRAKTLFAKNVPMAKSTPLKVKRFGNAKYCHVCKQPFEQDDKKVYVVPIVFYNLSEYDAHFIIKYMATAFKVLETKTNITACNSRFIDSYKFLSKSLEKLASYLKKRELRVTRTEFRDLSAEDFELLTRKVVFPYEYVDSIDKLLETSLPLHEAVYSSLTGETVTESEYAHATNVWRQFNIDNLVSYSNLYLKTNVLLLSDVLENFCLECLASYGLDPAYYTLPGYT